MNEQPEMLGPETAKAVQEVAKATGNAIDAARSVGSFFNRVLGNPITDFVGITVADPLKFVRAVSLDWYSRRVDEILKKRDAKIGGASPRIAIEILDHAQDETDETLRELWANLIANAMDEKTRSRVRVEFASILKQLNPLDAVVMKRLAHHHSYVRPRDFATAQNLDLNEVIMSIDYLIDLGCAQRPPNEANEYKLTARGLAILKAVDSV